MMNGDSSENTNQSEHTSVVEVPPSPTPPNATVFDYHYVTDALSSYNPNCYTTVWDEMFDNNNNNNNNNNNPTPSIGESSPYFFDCLSGDDNQVTPPPLTLSGGEYDMQVINSPSPFPPPMSVDSGTGQSPLTGIIGGGIIFDNQVTNPDPFPTPMSVDGSTGHSPMTGTIGGDQVTDPPPPTTMSVDGGEFDGQRHQVTSSTSSTLPSSTATLMDHDAAVEIVNATVPPNSMKVDSSINPRKQEGRPNKKARYVISVEQPDATTAVPPLQETQQQCNVMIPSGGCTPQHLAATSQLQMLTMISGLGSKSLEATIIRVACGMDVAEKITSSVAASSKKRHVFVSGTVGSLSRIQLLLEEKTVTYEGNYDIISLVGSFDRAKNDDRQMTGQLTLQVIGSDGVVFGGRVNGCLIAGCVVQMAVFCFNTSTGVKVKRKIKPAKNTTMKNDCEASSSKDKEGEPKEENQSEPAMPASSAQ